jgi:diguanylate cyclase
MTNSKQTKSALAPLDIARETFKQMAVRRIEPTPDNYHLIYNEIAGTPAKETLDSAIKNALKQLPNETTEQGKWINRWEKLLKQNNWAALPALLSEGMDTSVTFSTQWPNAIRELLQAWDAKQIGLDLPRKKEALERVLIGFGNDPLLAQKIQTVASGWQEYGTSSTTGSKAIELAGDEASIDGTKAQYPLVTPSNDLSSTTNLVAKPPEVTVATDSGVTVIEPDQFQETFRTLQDMLKQSLNHGLIPRLDGYPELKEEALQILILSEKARKIKDWQLMSKQFRALLVRVELIGANEEGMKQDLLRLLKLLIDNIGELVADDQWIRGQIAVIQTIIASPLERAMIQDAEKSLKEVIFKQGTLKHSLTEAKNAFKIMIATFVDRLGHMSTSSGTYQEKIGNYSDQLAETEDIAQINVLLENLMKDTHTMQTDIVRSREDLLQQRDQVDASQETILKLQEELSQLSEKVSIDQLTGVLNRRGLDEAMVREISRAQRGGSQLCVALLDIDNFKHFNDTYGHHVGDTALQHLAKVIQETVRPTDIAARFGGEEFVILLPDTSLNEAVETISRLQRALTKQFFLGNNERLLITFSAGVSLFKQNEEQVAVLNRADQAMYLAKKTGKNRVMTEVDLPSAKK